MLSVVLVITLVSFPVSLAYVGSADATSLPKASTPCTTSQLSLGVGGQVSPGTGEHGLILTLTNKSAKYCQLLGYPAVGLYTALGRVLPFTYDHGSQYFSHIVPHLVGLRPGTHGWFEVAKYRCDLGDLLTPSVIKVTVAPSAGASLTRLVPSSPGVGILAYCKGGVRDPGQLVGVTPIVATLRQLWT